MATNVTDAPPAIARIRHTPVRRELRVEEVARAGGSLVRVTLGGAALDGFLSLGFDDHLKFIFPDAHGQEQKRDITPRRFDPAARRLEVEIAEHAGGALTAWLAAARPGDQVAVAGPKTSVVVSPDYPWHVLAADPTGLPAAARRLEELPAGARAFVVLLEPDRRDRPALAGAADATVAWPADEDAFLAALADLPLPPGTGFVWAAGEASLMARVRDLFVERRGHPRGALRIAGYWKRDEAGFHETLERGEG